MHYLDMATDRRPLTTEPTNKRNNYRKALLFKTKLNGWINKTFSPITPNSRRECKEKKKIIIINK